MLYLCKTKRRVRLDPVVNLSGHTPDKLRQATSLEVDAHPTIDQAPATSNLNDVSRRPN